MLPSTTASVLQTPATEAERFLPEGPRSVIVEGRSALAWVNIQTSPDGTTGQVLLRFWNGEHRVMNQPRRPGFLLPTDRPNTVLIGMEKKLGYLDLATNQFRAIAHLDDQEPRTIINDAEIVPGGQAIVFGTKDVRFADPLAKLYLFTPNDGRLSVLAEEQICSNGKVFTSASDGLQLHDIDTPKRNVVRYSLDLNIRRLAGGLQELDLSREAGFPDGMVAVGDGTVIIAFYNPEEAPEGRAIRFELDTGRPIEEWRVPGAPRVTCPLLVEIEGMVHLVLTTATEGMPAEMQRACPNSGALFWAPTRIPVMPPTERVRAPAIGG